MNLYCCKIVEQSWGIEYCVEKNFIWAKDLDEARQVICKQWQVRKNKKGLQIEEIPAIRANAIKKKRTVVKTATTWNSFLQLAEDHSYYADETYHICSKCRGEVSYVSSLCPHCGALLK